MYTEWDSPVDGAVLWSSSGTDAPTRVLPDGCMDIIWHGDGVLVVGPDTGAHLSTLGAGRTLVALRFAPGVGPLVLGVPAHELRDTQVRLDEVWSGRDARLIHDADDPASALHTVAAQRLSVASSDFPARLVARAIASGATVGDLARRTAWSERQLHRKCLPAFGYGPKTLARILRFDRAMALSDSGVAPSVVAGRLGYSDQAHLSREVKALSGLTLGQLAAKRSTP
ncbi:AraC family transcriptional regulator [Rhodococcoides trifolii]|uniref:AraC family transcriptional regulator n=1 Tax=Rhodococcoides trifolii TaxID=908250 RepID=A0A917CT08_9NOCA|nr:AraC family transcriptional regulator [Rhodococcus trifolii]GGF95992.1 AraC family transcriptional regulator [Rhodococcus trifolii]